MTKKEFYEREYRLREARLRGDREIGEEPVRLRGEDAVRGEDVVRGRRLEDVVKGRERMPISGWRRRDGDRLKKNRRRRPIGEEQSSRYYNSRLEFTAVEGLEKSSRRGFGESVWVVSLLRGEYFGVHVRLLGFGERVFGACEFTERVCFGRVRFFLRFV
ncbi:hypothetical protein ACFE04_014474 [Oxalis oulophora]